MPPSASAPRTAVATELAIGYWLSFMSYDMQGSSRPALHKRL